MNTKLAPHAQTQVRTDRSHARFKYTVEDMGLKRLHAELKQRGVVLEPARPYELRSNKDAFGVRVNEKTKTKDYTLYVLLFFYSLIHYNARTPTLKHQQIDTCKTAESRTTRNKIK